MEATTKVGHYPLSSTLSIGQTTSGKVSYGAFRNIEDRNAQLARRSDCHPDIVCALVYTFGLVSCADSGRRSDFDPWQTNRHSGVVGDGPAPESTFSELSSRAQ